MSDLGNKDVFAYNLKRYMEKKGVDRNQLCSALGLKYSTVSEWITAKKYPRIDRIELLARYFAIQKSDLIERERTGTAAPALPSNILPLPKTRKIPLLGTIACGEPITAVENVEQYIDVADDIHCTFALRCKGDSMIDARIMDGDVVYIREQPQVENGEIAAVLIEDEATLKRVYLSEGVVQLVPCNAKYSPMVYTDAQLDTIRILGKAVAFTSLVR